MAFEATEHIISILLLGIRETVIERLERIDHFIEAISMGLRDFLVGFQIFNCRCRRFVRMPRIDQRFEVGIVVAHRLGERVEAIFLIGSDLQLVMQCFDAGFDIFTHHAFMIMVVMLGSCCGRGRIRRGGENGGSDCDAARESCEGKNARKCGSQFQHGILNQNR